MAVTAKWYGPAIAKAFNKEIDFNDGNVKVMLLTALTIDQDDAYLSDVTYTEVANGNGYTTGGQALGTPVVNYASKVTTLDAVDTVWTTATISATHALIFYNTGIASTSPVIAYVDFGGTFSSTSGTFTLAWNASGIATITVG